MTERQRTRRRVLASVTAVGVAGIAGCGGSSPTDDSGDTASNPSSGSDSSDDPDPTGRTTDSTMPSDPQESTDGLSAPVLGDPDASVTVMVFEDYACPHCRDYSLNVFPELKTQYIDTEEIRYEFRDFPIPVSDESSRAASAARAVQVAAGDEAYFTYSKGLFQNQSDLGLDTYESLANNVAADPTTVREAAAENRYSETVQADRDYGVDIGITGTPGIVVDGSVLSGAASVENISSAIEDAL